MNNILKALAVLPCAAICLAAAPVQRSASDGVAAATLQILVADSLSEIRLSQLAKSRSKNVAIRAFAEHIITDHELVIRNAQQVAQTASLPAPELKQSDEGIIDAAHLASYRGHEFDVAFVRTSIDDHQKDIEGLRHASEVVTNPLVRQFIRTVQGQLEQHEAYANGVADAVALDKQR